MCGIVGYVGSGNATEFLIDGLRRLEYRGYDSAGIAVYENGKINIEKKQGRLVNLENVLKEHPLHGHIGIGHTRWATHGKPSDRNAHPHGDCHNHFVVVHNGIIENYLTLKKELTEKAMFSNLKRIRKSWLICWKNWMMVISFPLSVKCLPLWKALTVLSLWMMQIRIPLSAPKE